MTAYRIAACAAALCLVWAGATGASDTTDFHNHLDHFIEDALGQIPVIPGLSVAVVSGGEVVFLEGYGVRDAEEGLPVTPSTGFYIASSTKSFVGMAASELMSEGRLDPDAPVSRYLPDLELPAPLSADSVTIEMLLTHQSGIGNRDVQMYLAFRDSLPLAAFEAAMREKSEPIPSRFIYSNLGYNTMGYVLESVTGESWKQVVEEKVTRPLGMTNTTMYMSRAERGELARPYIRSEDAFTRMDQKSDGMMHAAGGIVTTADDATKWLLANLHDGRLDGRQVLPADAVERAQAAHAVLEAGFYEYQRFAYGYGWYHSRYDGELLVHHFGGYNGYHAHISFMPDHDIGVAVFMNTNAYGASMLTHMVANYAYETLLGRPDVDGRFAAMAADLAKEVAAKKRAQDGLDQAKALAKEGKLTEAEVLVLKTIKQGAADGVLDESAINRIGYDFLQNGATQVAITAFQFNAEQYPESSNVYDSLGEAYEEAGRLEDAKKMYEYAIMHAESKDLIEAYRQHTKRVARKLLEQDG